MIDRASQKGKKTDTSLLRFRRRCLISVRQTGSAEKHTGRENFFYPLENEQLFEAEHDRPKRDQNLAYPAREKNDGIIYIYYLSVVVRM